jgi:hypothetical protein
MNQESLELYFADGKPEAETLAETIKRTADEEFPPNGASPVKAKSTSRFLAWRR